MEEFFNSLEDSAEIRVKRKQERSQIRTRTVAGRTPSLPACTTCQAQLSRADSFDFNYSNPRALSSFFPLRSEAKLA